jgi:hypothetical protein
MKTPQSSERRFAIESLNGFFGFFGGRFFAVPLAFGGSDFGALSVVVLSINSGVCMCVRNKLVTKNFATL